MSRWIAWPVGHPRHWMRIVDVMAEKQLVAKLPTGPAWRRYTVRRAR